MDFLANNANENKIDLPAPVLIYPHLQAATAPCKKVSCPKIGEALTDQNVHGRVKTTANIIVIILLIMIVTLGCVAITVFSENNKSTASQASREIEHLERIEFRRKEWIVLSGSIVVQTTCKQRPYCNEIRITRSAEFSYTSLQYISWLDRILRLSHFQRDYVGTLITRIKCVRPQDRDNISMVDFHTIWDVSLSEVVLPTPQQLGQVLTLQVMTENRIARRPFNFDLTSVTIGTYRSKDDESAKNAPQPVPVDCQGRT